MYYYVFKLLFLHAMKQSKDYNLCNPFLKLLSLESEEMAEWLE